MAVPKKKTSKAKSRSRRASAWRLGPPPRSDCPQCHRAKLPHVVCPNCGWYGGRQAIDVEGSDRGPAEMVEGAARAAASGVPVLLVGDPRAIGATDLEVQPAAEVIAMTEEPGTAVRRKKDSSLVRAAEAVRDGRASAMVSAGNTGAAMASALLRMGRLPGVTRPAIATPIPVPGATPTVLLDAGANADCLPGWLVQFAQMGAVFSSERYGIERPRVGLLSIGEEATKGNAVVKEANPLMADAGLNFVGNVEGRDVMTDKVDVVVTDGFTGNVVLKTLEGGMRCLVGAVTAAFASTPEAREAAKVLSPRLVPLVAELDPDSTGGAMLLGVRGVCIISHGSSSADAVANAVRVASEMGKAGLVDRIRDAVTTGSGKT